MKKHTHESDSRTVISNDNAERVISSRVFNKINVHIAHDGNIEKDSIFLIRDFIENTGGPIRVQASSLILNPVLDECNDMEWGATFLEIRKLRQSLMLEDNSFLCFLTKYPNEANWYSANEFCFDQAYLSPLKDPTPYNFFVHFNEFDWLPYTSGVPISVQAIIKQVTLGLLIAFFKESRHVDSFHHYKTKGCFFDFCKNKEDLQFRFRSAYICGDCLETLECIPNSDLIIEQIVKVLEMCRLESLPTQRYLKGVTSIFNSWPFPIAITRHLYDRSEKSMYKLFRMLDHFDNLIRYVVITESLWNNIELDIPARPSLGHWVEMLRNIGRDQDIKLISELISMALRITEREKIVNFRNEYRGHGYILHNPDEYNEPLNQLENAVLRIEQALRPVFLSKKLVLVQEIDLDDENYYILNGEMLQGSNSLFPKWTHKTNADPRHLNVRKNKIMLVDSSFTKFVAADPYIVKSICSHCGLNHVLINDGEMYIDIQQGHRTRNLT